MTWQSLSCLAQSPSASSIAARSDAAFSPRPGRPVVPTADRAPARWRVGELAHDDVARIGRDRGVAHRLKEARGSHDSRHRHNKHVVRGDDHAGHTGERAAGFQAAAVGFLQRIDAEQIDELAAWAERDRL